MCVFLWAGQWSSGVAFRMTTRSIAVRPHLLEVWVQDDGGSQLVDGLFTPVAVRHCGTRQQQPPSGQDGRFGSGGQAMVKHWSPPTVVKARAKDRGGGVCGGAGLSLTALM